MPFYQHANVRLDCFSCLLQVMVPVFRRNSTGAGGNCHLPKMRFPVRSQQCVVIDQTDWGLHVYFGESDFKYYSAWLSFWKEESGMWCCGQLYWNLGAVPKLPAKRPESVTAALEGDNFSREESKKCFSVCWCEVEPGCLYIYKLGKIFEV